MAINYNDGSSVKAINFNGNDVKVVKVEDSNNPNGVVAWSKPITVDIYGNYCATFTVSRNKTSISEPTTSNFEVVCEQSTGTQNTKVYYGDTVNSKCYPKYTTTYQKWSYYKFEYLTVSLMNAGSEVEELIYISDNDITNYDGSHEVSDISLTNVDKTYNAIKFTGVYYIYNNVGSSSTIDHLTTGTVTKNWYYATPKFINPYYLRFKFIIGYTDGREYNATCSLYSPSDMYRSWYQGISFIQNLNLQVFTDTSYKREFWSVPKYESYDDGFDPEAVSIKVVCNNYVEETTRFLLSLSFSLNSKKSDVNRVVLTEIALIEQI